MKRIFLAVFLFGLFQFNLLFSQFTSGGLYNSWKTLATREANVPFTYKDVDGSPYYSNEFLKSTVYLKDGSYATVPIRYDIFQDEVEFMQDNKILWLNKKDIRNILYGSELVFVTSPNEDTAKLSYFFLLGTGKFTLYVKKKVGFHQAIPPKGYSPAVADRFEREKDEFYIKAKGMPARKFNSKKSLLKILSDNGAAQAYIKKEKIKADDSEDLKKLITFLNIE